MGFFNSKCESTARLDGKTVVITGANTGIGKITARDMYQRGAKVIMACRSMDKANAAVEDIKTECSNQQNLGKIETIELDLGNLKSIRSCAMKILEKENRVEILINNAGIMACPMMRTVDGFEMQFGTNHLGHFLFTLLLLPKIKNSTPARIVNVSSLAHLGGTIKFDDLNWEKRSYSAIGAYNQSKLANVLFTKELTRRLDEAGIKDVHTYSLHPGAIKTELGRHLGDTYFKAITYVFSAMSTMFMKTPEQGAQTTIHCAVSEQAAKETGLYYAECKVTSSSRNSMKMDDAKRLWDESLKLVGLGENYDPFVL